MALVYEKVKEEDWELYNSFLPNEKADRHTRWVVDREKNIYSFWIGGETREEEKIYFLAWNNLKIYIYTKVRIYVETEHGQKAHIWVNHISLPQVLESDEKKINEIIEITKEMLQLIYEYKVFFETMPKITFRRGDN